MSGVYIDGNVLGKRLDDIYKKTWENTKTQEGFSDVSSGQAADSLAIITGKSTEGTRYMKSISLEMWLFAYELPETLILLLRNRQVHVVTGKTKANLISAAKDVVKEQHKIDIHLHTKLKGTTGEDHFKKVLEEAAKLNSDSDKKSLLGHLPKEKHEGAFFETWNKVVAGESGLATVDVSVGFAGILSVKSSDEQTNAKKAAYLATQAMTKFVVPRLETIIDEEKKVKHSTLTSLIEDRLLEPSKLDVRLKRDKVNTCYPPIVQSGGKYNLKINAESNNDILKYDTVIVSLGAKYASYCSNVSRTIFVDPTNEQQKYYEALVKAQAACVKAMKVGDALKTAHKAVLDSFEESGCPELAKHLANKYVGFGMGLEFKESAYAITEKNERIFQPGMIFNACVSLAGLKNGDAKTRGDQPEEYSMQISDSVLVKEGSVACELLTDVPKQWKDISYLLNEDDDEEEENNKENQSQVKRERGGNKSEESLPSKRSSAMRMTKEEREQEENTEAQRREKQEELTQKINEETLRYLTQSKLSDDKDKTKEVKDPVAYASPAEVPHSSKDGLIKVDPKAESVVLPMYGLSVPFHISVIKNVTNSNDHDHSFVRIIFHSPSAMHAAGPLVQRHIRDAFLKEVSFRCTDVRHANKIVQEIKTMRRLVQQRESQKLERATLVVQEKLIPGRGRVPNLSDVWIRPTLGGRGKKLTGSLEAHTNGFRYHSPKGEHLDVMYGNIKHAFFQPAEKEMICLIHFHLYDDIMVGKKKSKEVQFYTEVMDVVQTLDAGRRNAYDPDEIEDEQRERERRNRTNNEYNNYVKKVQELWERERPQANLEFDIPFRELGFPGVPHKSTSFVIPTVYCLVDLIEVPFFVLTLSEVAVVNLERVGFGLKNFDMVFVFKDFDKEPHRIDAIPSSNVEQLKEWLTSMNLKYYENKMNLVWKPILKTIKEDPEGFIADGGWEFLNMEASEDEEEEEESEEFEPEESDESEEDDDDESDFEEDEDEDEDEEDEDEEDEELDSEEGKTWEELEEEAKRDDRRKGRDDDSDDDRSAKRRKHRRR